MSQANDILDFIKRNCKVEVFINLNLNLIVTIECALCEHSIPFYRINLGITALEIQNEYGILRNNASSILNLLCKNGKLVKINSRPVTFIDKEILNEMNKKYNVPIKNIYTFNELREYILNTSINDPFEMLDMSLLCIYFLTGDKMFYEQNRNKLINIIASYDGKRFNYEN